MRVSAARTLKGTMTDDPLRTRPAGEENEEPTAAAHEDRRLQGDLLDYIIQMTVELAVLAREARCDLCGYFLAMASHEANAARRTLPSRAQMD